MYKIKTLNNISKIGIARLHENLYVCSEDIEKPDGIILRSADLKKSSIPSGVLAIARAGAGVNNIPIEECTQKGICVFNTPGANANAVKELVIGAMFVAARNMPEAIDWVKTIANKGDDIPSLVEKGKSAFIGPELAGKNLGIIGLGAIGVGVANAAVALGMTVYGYDPYISVNAAWGLSRAVQHSTDLNEIFKNCDYITIHIPETEVTRGFFNKENIMKMKDGVRLLNFARGGLAKTEDILEAVRVGKISCYVTDFPDKNLVEQRGIIAIPHLGASTPESEENCASMAARELANYIECGSIVNSVNFPDCELMPPEHQRITIINKNVPGMLAAITSIATNLSINIDNLQNKSGKNSSVAYTVIDINSTKVDLLLTALEAVDGVIRVRKIENTK